jgi:hypothetical protein
VFTEFLHFDRDQLRHERRRRDAQQAMRRPGRLGRQAHVGLAACGALAAALLLAGCVETVADFAPKTEAHAQFTRRPDVSLAGASVAFVSVDGPPAAISASFSQIMAREATAHDIVVADAKSARYLVRGYLSAYATTDGAAVEYVWDVFNKDRQRTQRVNDVLEVKGDGADPWRIVGEAALASVAAKSADDLAAFLSNTPEAIASAAAPAAAAPVQAVSEAKPLSYAPVD